MVWCVLGRQKELCTVLQEHFSIPVAVSDFMVSEEHEGQALYSVVPLQGVHIQENDSLLVVTCSYALAERRAGAPSDFYLAPETVEFHLIEHMPASKIRTHL
jgi:hypothetical protein